MLRQPSVIYPVFRRGSITLLVRIGHPSLYFLLIFMTIVKRPRLYKYDMFSDPFLQTLARGCMTKSSLREYFVTSLHKYSEL